MRTFFLYNWDSFNVGKLLSLKWSFGKDFLEADKESIDLLAGHRDSWSLYSARYRDSSALCLEIQIIEEVRKHEWYPHKAPPKLISGNSPSLDISLLPKASVHVRNIPLKLRYKFSYGSQLMIKVNFSLMMVTIKPHTWSHLLQHLQNFHRPCYEGSWRQ